MYKCVRKLDGMKCDCIFVDLNSITFSEAIGDDLPKSYSFMICKDNDGNRHMIIYGGKNELFNVTQGQLIVIQKKTIDSKESYITVHSNKSFYDFFTDKKEIALKDIFFWSTSQPDLNSIAYFLAGKYEYIVTELISTNPDNEPVPEAILSRMPKIKKSAVQIQVSKTELLDTKYSDGFLVKDRYDETIKFYEHYRDILKDYDVTGGNLNG